MPLVRDLYDIWAAKRGGRDLPDRHDFDPADLKSLMANMMIGESTPHKMIGEPTPHKMIGEPIGAPFRLRYRLVGTRVAKVSGFDFTGRHLDEVLRPDLPEDWHAHYLLSYQRRIPVFGQIDCPTKSGIAFTYEFGIFPLRLGQKNGGQEQVGQFFSIEDYGTLEPFADQLSDRL